MSENRTVSARVESYNELRFNKAFRSSQSTNWTSQRLSSTWRGTNHTGLRLSTSSLAASSPFGARNSYHVNLARSQRECRTQNPVLQPAMVVLLCRGLTVPRSCDTLHYFSASFTASPTREH